MLDAWFALTAFLLARNEWLKSCVVAVAYWAALCGEWGDALKMLFVFALAFRGRIIPAIGLSITYAVWTALKKVSYRYSVSELPEWWEFCENLERAGRARWGRYSQRPGDACQVCGALNRRPYELPCNRSHLICMDCVIRRCAEDKNYCPICRRPLYRLQDNEGALYTVVIACLCTLSAFHMIAVGLKVYRGFYPQEPLETFFFALISIAMWFQFKPWHTLDEDFVAQWSYSTLGRYAFYLTV